MNDLTKAALLALLALALFIHWGTTPIGGPVLGGTTGGNIAPGGQQ